MSEVFNVREKMPPDSYWLESRYIVEVKHPNTGEWIRAFYYGSWLNTSGHWFRSEGEFNGANTGVIYNVKEWREIVSATQGATK